MSRHSFFFRSVAILVLLAVTGFGAALLATLHYHVLADGLVVAHSHPLPDDNHRKTHKHTRQEYVELDAAAQILDTLVLGLVQAEPLLPDLRDDVVSEDVSIPISVSAWHFFRRGPPFMSYS